MSEEIDKRPKPGPADRKWLLSPCDKKPYIPDSDGISAEGWDD
jgi:hypothetical protein